MDVILHIGSHRSGTTSFQRYLRGHSDRLGATATGFWGPLRTRGGLFDGVARAPLTPRDARAAARGAGRVQINLARMRKAGLDRLLVSDENMLGTIRGNIRHLALYRDAGERLARHGAAFGGQVTRIALQIRALDAYWASALAYALPRGAPLPRTAELDRIAGAARGWRDVITDIACAVPAAEIVVTRHEDMAGRADRLFQAITGQRRLAARGGDIWCNHRPDLAQLRRVMADRGEAGALPDGTGHWQPFDAAGVAALRETWADDLLWLRGGADGLARYHEEEGRTPAATQPPGPPMTRGQEGHEHEKGRMAQTG